MQQRILIAALIVVVGTIGCAAYVAAVTSAGVRPKSYREAVMRVLNERQGDHHDNQGADGCAPSYQSCRTYAGTWRIVATSVMSGHIDCRERWTVCVLTIPEARISGVPLDDVRDPLFDRWEEIYGRFLVWIRFAYRGSGMSHGGLRRIAMTIIVGTRYIASLR